MSESKHTLEFMENQLADCIRLQEALEQAAVMIRSKAHTLSESCLEAAEQFRREGTDWHMQIQEVKIHMANDKNV